MQYALPKDLHKQFWTSLKTVYNYLSKHKANIRIKKENGKTFVNIEDFKNCFYNTSKSVQNVQIETSVNPSNKGFENWNPTLTKLQNENQYLQDKNTSLQKRNEVIEKQIGEYGIMLADTKKEKAVLFDKYEQLNQKYNDKLESFSLERLKWSRKFYILLGVSLVFGLIILWLLYPYLLNYLT